MHKIWISSGGLVEILYPITVHCWMVNSHIDSFLDNVRGWLGRTCLARGRTNTTVSLCVPTILFYE